MKIALVLSAAPAYSETFFNSLIRGLKDKGHDVTIYTAKAKKKYNFCRHITHPPVYNSFILQFFSMVYIGFLLLPYFKKVKLYFRLEKNEGTSLKRIIEKIYLNSALLRYKGDWVHFGFATTALQRELVPKAVGAKMAVSLRGYDINVYPLKHPHCYDLLWRCVDKVHSISTYLLNKAFELGFDQKKQFEIIHPAVNIKGLPKFELNNNKTKSKIVTIARFDWIKGLELLTEVALLLKNKGIQFEWILIGGGEGNERERYLFDVSEKQLFNQLIHKGKRSHEETLNILKDCDVYVQTSLNEGFCNAVLEAQAIGVPSVAFRVGGLPENIIDAETGWLIEAYDVQAMSSKIFDLLTLTTKERTRISHNSIRVIREKFNSELQNQYFHKFYTNS